MEDMDIDDDELETLIQLTKDDPGAGCMYVHTPNKELMEDFDTYMQCWGNTHILVNKSEENIATQRTMYVYEFRCGREFKTEYDTPDAQMNNVESKPSNACPGCDPAVDEISKW